MFQGTHGTGKIGKMAKKKSVRVNTGNLEILSKHREFCLNTGNLEILSKHREFCLNTGNFVSSSCKCSDSKSKGYCDSCRKKVHFFSRSWIGLPSQFCVCNTHKLCKVAQGKFAVGQGKHRENTLNLKIQFEWVPWLNVFSLTILHIVNRYSCIVVNHLK